MSDKIKKTFPHIYSRMKGVHALSRQIRIPCIREPFVPQGFFIYIKEAFYRRHT